MPAPEGNLNAQIWTEDKVITLMSELCERAEGKGYYTLFRAVEPQLSIDQYEYLLKKYESNEVVSQSLKKLKAIIQANITEDAMSGKIKETMSIFILKCNHGLQDKQSIEVEHKGTISVNFNLPDTDTE